MQQRQSLERINWILLGALIAVVSISCTYQRKFRPPPIGLPEQIYISNTNIIRYTPRILICPFRSPEYAPASGQKAAAFLADEIYRKNLRAHINQVDQTLSHTPERLTELARVHRCEFIITGEILYALDGGITRASKVVQEIKIYRLPATSLQIIGHAQAVETAPVLPDTDFIFVEGKGQPALSAESLMKRNAAKFARFISQIFTGPTENG